MKSSAKIILAITANAALFANAIKSNNQHTQAISQLSSWQKTNLAVRDLALSDNGFYRSDNPYLRSMAIAQYQDNPHLKIKGKFMHEEIRRNNMTPT